MTDRCLPPPKTKPGSEHVLSHISKPGYTERRTWTGTHWSHKWFNPRDLARSATPRQMYSVGWRYVGPTTMVFRCKRRRSFTEVMRDDPRALQEKQDTMVKTSRLRDAAPKLLEALKELLEPWADMSDTILSSDVTAGHRILRARAAVKLAESISPDPEISMPPASQSGGGMHSVGKVVTLPVVGEI